MVKMHVIYEGDLHTVCVHEATGQMLHTDAPVENFGKGRTFSPTDLIAVSLASCVATLMGIYAERKNIDLRGMRIDVQKEMSTTPPRKIRRLILDIYLATPIAEQERVPLQKAAHSCPVSYSLHPEIEQILNFHWQE